MNDAVAVLSGDFQKADLAAYSMNLAFPVAAKNIVTNAILVLELVEKFEGISIAVEAPARLVDPNRLRRDRHKQFPRLLFYPRLDVGGRIFDEFRVEPIDEALGGCMGILFRFEDLVETNGKIDLPALCTSGCRAGFFGKFLPQFLSATPSVAPSGFAVQGFEPLRTLARS